VGTTQLAGLQWLDGSDCANDSDCAKVKCVEHYRGAFEGVE
jgi:hypothetical protein